MNTSAIVLPCPLCGDPAHPAQTCVEAVPWDRVGRDDDGVCVQLQDAGPWGTVVYAFDHEGAP